MFVFVNKWKRYDRTACTVLVEMPSRTFVDIDYCNGQVGAFSRRIDTIAGYYGFGFKGHSEDEPQRD